MTASAPQSALIVEDLPSASAWLAAALADAFPGIATREAPDLAAARAAIAAAGPPDLAIVDLGLPDGSGVDLIRHLTRTAPATQCVVATIFNDDVHLFPALRAGAAGYLLKDQPRERIVSALRGIVAGEPPLSPAIARRLLQMFAPAEVADDQPLTPRERECLMLIAKGLKVADVAVQLGVTRNTAATYVKSIYRKLDVSSRAEAALEAVRLGLAKAEL